MWSVQEVEATPLQKWLLDWSFKIVPQVFSQVLDLMRQVLDCFILSADLYITWLCNYLDSWLWNLVCASVSLHRCTSSQVGSPRDGQTRARVNVTGFFGHVLIPFCPQIQRKAGRKQMDCRQHVPRNCWLTPSISCQTDAVLLQSRQHQKNNPHAADATRATSTRLASLP